MFEIQNLLKSMEVEISQISEDNETISSKNNIDKDSLGCYSRNTNKCCIESHKF